MTLLKMLLCIVLSCALTACGTARRPSPEVAYPVVTVYVQPSTNLSTLPLQVAQRLGLFAQQHIRVKWVRHQDEATLEVGHAQPPHPIDGLVTQKPDLVLVAPVADPHFRWRSLTHLPVFYAKGAATLEPYLKAVMAAHQVVPEELDALNFSQIMDRWQQKTLPWVVVTLQDYFQLRGAVPHSTVLAFIGASTGSVPVTVITGTSPHALAFVSAVNLALWYLHTTSPESIAQLLRADRPNPFLGSVVKRALHYQYWPTTVVLTPSLYQRGQRLLAPLGPWPPYTTRVDAKLAEAALTYRAP